jgi:hypothetical protein
MAPAQKLQHRTASGSLDAPAALLVYFLQRHAAFRSQYDPLPCPGCRCVRPRYANYEPQCARGMRSLTNRIFELRINQATTRKRGWWLFHLQALFHSIQMNLNLVQANHGYGKSCGGNVEVFPQPVKPAVIFRHFRHD